MLLYSPLASDSGSLRITCFNHGCNMVTASMPDAQHVLRLIAGISSRLGQGPYACPTCGLTGLTEDDLHEHYPLYHVNETNVTVCCPICSVTCEPRRLPFPPHLYNRYRITPYFFPPVVPQLLVLPAVIVACDCQVQLQQYPQNTRPPVCLSHPCLACVCSHGPPSRRADHHSEETEGRPLYAYALVVCRHPHTGRFLLVQEFSNSGYWLPGGRVDPGTYTACLKLLEGHWKAPRRGKEGLPDRTIAQLFLYLIQLVLIHVCVDRVQRRTSWQQRSERQRRKRVYGCS